MSWNIIVHGGLISCCFVTPRVREILLLPQLAEARLYHQRYSTWRLEHCWSFFKYAGYFVEGWHFLKPIQKKLLIYSVFILWA